MQITYGTLDPGIYDYGKAKNKKTYRIYYGDEAQDRFEEAVLQDERLSSSGLFGEWITGDDGSTAFFMEQWAYEYCPELDYVLIAGGHGYVSAYDLVNLEEIFINPSTYVYSPSGRYRFGTYYGNEQFYTYIEVREGEGYTPNLLGSGYAEKNAKSGFYWEDENTLYYLTRHTRSDGTVYHIGRWLRFIME